MHNTDLSRIINSDKVQSVVQPIKKDVKRHTLKRNPLKNLYTKLNPYAKMEEAAAIKAAGPAWYKTMISDTRGTLESFATNLMHYFQQFYVIPASSPMAASNGSPVFALALI
ncbi:hypothetical protein C4D60_Mb02t13630 [Musa balbisiana]|uniref:Large ribosomal subunit protein uL4 C-terminal domain-containing protein n=1 Tax=Musa balbisiana TaxID=52838 RepID=A0A4S8IBT9_MUSBA|nr:hypothetical protein C4D60_Mb02t13630 [Musa balbisiana]